VHKNAFMADLSRWETKNLKVVMQNADIFSFFNQIWILPTDFHKIPQYQILLKSVLWEPR
jgi:hypothetical protein